MQLEDVPVIRSENDNGELATGQVLLIRVLITPQEHFGARKLSFSQKFTILQLCPTQCFRGFDGVLAQGNRRL